MSGGGVVYCNIAVFLTNIARHIDDSPLGWGWGVSHIHHVDSSSYTCQGIHWNPEAIRIPMVTV